MRCIADGGRETRNERILPRSASAVASVPPLARAYADERAACIVQHHADGCATRSRNLLAYRKVQTIVKIAAKPNRTGVTASTTEAATV